MFLIPSLDCILTITSNNDIILIFFCSDTRPLLRFSADTVPIRAVAWAPSERFVVVEFKLNFFILLYYCRHTPKEKRIKIEEKREVSFQLKFCYC